MNFKPIPAVLRPFSPEVIVDLQTHTREIRRLFDVPGVPYHDQNESADRKMNRWYWHNLPLLTALHHSPDFIKLISDHFGQPLKPSYVFLSMYGPEGVVPLHQDRPQCQFTVDLQLASDGEWPIYVEDIPYLLKPGEALCYSGTGQKHYRKPMQEDGKNCTWMNLAFFHFVPTNWVGSLE